MLYSVMTIVKNLKKLLRPILLPLLKRRKACRDARRCAIEIIRIRKELSNRENLGQFVFYLGITAHSNLGDMGQYYCIRKWITENYSDATLVEVESDTVVNQSTGFVDLLKSKYRAEDVIVFQSGYTTQDLGGNHEEMHRLICDNLPYAHILMFPQTILFQHEENKKRCELSYNKAKRMLFLARDMVSYGYAKEMFSELKVLAYPDIVTTLIGTLSFNHKRNGVCLCRRDDSEKFYSDKELKQLKSRLEEVTNVVVTDTTISKSYRDIRAQLKETIEEEIEKYSKFDVTITDRYHGTIFSLIAGTPVIIIKSTDHKVVTGADWFKGIYDDYVYVAQDLDDAYEIYRMIMKKNLNHSLKPYFKSEYYDKLKDVFETL